MVYHTSSRSLPEKEESKQQHYEEHRQWLDDQHQAGRLLFPDRLPIAPMEFISCSHQARARRSASPLKIRIM